MAIILGLVIGVFVGTTLGFLLFAVLSAAKCDEQVGHSLEASARKERRRRFVSDAEPPD